MRRRKDPWDQPWVAIAAVGGIIAVVIIALVFFMSGGNTGGQVASGQSPSTQAAPASSAPSTTASVTGIKPESIKAVPTPTISDTGVSVKVSYIGGFSGIYGINGKMENVSWSGERVFPLNATTGVVSATFHKEDGSTRHEITVEIYKDGKVLKFAKNASAYGQVNVTCQV